MWKKNLKKRPTTKFGITTLNSERCYRHCIASVIVTSYLFCMGIRYKTLKFILVIDRLLLVLSFDSTAHNIAVTWFFSLLFLLYCRICFGQLYNIQLLLFYIRTHCCKFLLIPAATQPQYCLTQRQMNIKQNKKKTNNNSSHAHTVYGVSPPVQWTETEKKLAIDRSNPHHTIENAVVVVFVVVVAFNTTSHMNLHTNTLNLQHSTR